MRWIFTVILGLLALGCVQGQDKVVQIQCWRGNDQSSQDYYRSWCVDPRGDATVNYLILLDCDQVEVFLSQSGFCEEKHESRAGVGRKTKNQKEHWPDTASPALEECKRLLLKMAGG